MHGFLNFHYLGQVVKCNYIHVNLSCNNIGGIFHPNQTLSYINSFLSNEMCNHVALSTDVGTTPRAECN